VLYLKPRSRFDIIRELVRQGVLPYRPQPIPASSLRAPKGDIALRPKQARDFETFLACGAVSVFATGGSGKTFFGMYAAETIAGPKLILAPRRAILDQWQARMRAHCPQAINETEFRTYQSLHRSLPRKTYGLIIYDEVQYMPADMGIKAAQLESIARCGRSAERSRRSLSATPWREDGNEDIIPALCGFPVGGDWSASPPPDSTVWIVDRPGHKADQVERLVSIPKAGKTIVYVYRLEFGQTLSQRLGVPFISGKTGNVLDTLHQHDTVVMSKVGDAGLSINATRVIEADFLGGRTEIGQRALRTQHAVRLSSRRSRPARGVSHDSDQKGIQHPQPPAIGAVCAGSGCALCGGGSGGVGVGLAETAVAQGVSGVR
jgi:DNA excision repair protein ERCC-3